MVLQGAAHEDPIRVGVIGLGIGTLAAYGRPGDLYRFYEIDPAVVDPLKHLAPAREKRTRAEIMNKQKEKIQRTKAEISNLKRLS